MQTETQVNSEQHPQVRVDCGVRGNNGYDVEFALKLQAVQHDIDRAKKALKDKDFDLAELAFVDAATRCRQLKLLSKYTTA